jgi:glucokinase
VGIFPGTGIGGGCVYQDEIFHGANCTCMEIGHIPISADGPRDGCGNKGTLESLASRLSIAGSAVQAAYRGHAPALREDVGTDISQVRSGALKSAVEAGDKVIKQIIYDAADYLALGVVTVVHLLAPDVIVLGGGLVEAMPDLFVERVKKAAKDRVLPSYRDVFKVVAAELGDDATAMGAAAWAKKSISKGNSK